MCLQHFTTLDYVFWSFYIIRQAACLAYTAYTCIANIKQHTYNNQQGLIYLPYCAHTLCIGCHLGWQSVTIDPVPPWDHWPLVQGLMSQHTVPL